MQVGDLVHAPRYAFWGLGIVLELGNEKNLVYWFDEPSAETWTALEHLEIL